MFFVHLRDNLCEPLPTCRQAQRITKYKTKQHKGKNYIDLSFSIHPILGSDFSDQIAFLSEDICYIRYWHQIAIVVNIINFKT